MERQLGLSLEPAGLRRRTATSSSCRTRAARPAYGQQFTNEISGDWGGKVFADLMNGVAKVASMPFVDKSRVGAAGASYGGYMVNWILGHNDRPARAFKALVSHAGVFNLTSMYGATEELWFPEWEFKGTPWDEPRDVRAVVAAPLRARTSRRRRSSRTASLTTACPSARGCNSSRTCSGRASSPSSSSSPTRATGFSSRRTRSFWYTSVLDWLDKHLKDSRQ